MAYQRAVWNLATETLPAAGWADFRKLPEFPDRAQPDVKLEFLSRYLKDALAPEDIRANPNLRHEHMRGDLNKYHPWLLRAVLRHLYETHISHIQSPLRLPEDLPKVIADLHLFHKNYRELAEKTGDTRKGSIQHYGTLDEFHKVIDLVRPPPCPLDAYERERAFKKHLKEYGGDDGATTLATLSNGTIAIQLNTKAASIAFGSPHWCTAYRTGETWFDKYKDNLILILAADGRRHQLHFRTHQFNDANDNRAKLSDILNFNQGLTETLSPILRQALETCPRTSPMALRDYLEMCAGIPAFEDEIIRAGIAQKALEGAIKNGRPDYIPHIVHLCLKNPRFTEALATPKGICQALNMATYTQNGAARRIIECAAENKHLAEALAKPEGIPAALRKIADKISGKILHNDYRILRKACQLNVLFIRALISPEGFPQLIQEAERSGNKIKLRSLKDEYENLKDMAATQTYPISGNRSAAACLPAPVLQSML